MDESQDPELIHLSLTPEEASSLIDDLPETYRARVDWTSEDGDRAVAKVEQALLEHHRNGYERRIERSVEEARQSLRRIPELIAHRDFRQAAGLIEQMREAVELAEQEQRSLQEARGETPPESPSNGRGRLRPVN